jgi:hypothetical protein
LGDERWCDEPGAQVRQSTSPIRSAECLPLPNISNLILFDSIVSTYTSNFLFDAVWILPWDVFNYILYAGVLALLVVPVCTYIAILRYRLYDIDVVINRTLVYGALTATLALVYFGGVATAESIFRALTGQEQQPQLAVVVSTLVIAALFNPLRRRIQGIKVVREDNGGVPGVGRATIRTLLRIIDGFFSYLVAFITVLISGKNQRLGDMAAHTLVVRK